MGHEILGFGLREWSGRKKPAGAFGPGRASFRDSDCYARTGPAGQEQQQDGWTMLMPPAYPGPSGPATNKFVPFLATQRSRRVSEAPIYVTPTVTV